MSVDITDNTEEILGALQQQIEAGLEAVGIQAEGYAALNLENSPRRIDTGLLRNSITHAISGKSPAKGTYKSDDGSKSGSYSGTAPNDADKAVYIGTNVEYAGYVHDGTSKMAPNRFLSNAASSHASEYREILEEYLKGE